MTNDYEMRRGWDKNNEQEVLILKHIVDNYYIAEGWCKGYLIINIDDIELESEE